MTHNKLYAVQTCRGRLHSVKQIKEATSVGRVYTEKIKKLKHFYEIELYGKVSTQKKKTHKTSPDNQNWKCKYQ